MEPEDATTIMVLIMVALLAAALAGCVRMPARPTDTHVTRVCVINILDNKCWVDKASGDGLNLGEMNGYFAESPDDLTDMMSRMSCQKGN